MRNRTSTAGLRNCLVTRYHFEGQINSVKKWAQSYTRHECKKTPSLSEISSSATALWHKVVSSFLRHTWPQVLKKGSRSRTSGLSVRQTRVVATKSIILYRESLPSASTHNNKFFITYSLKFDTSYFRKCWQLPTWNISAKFFCFQEDFFALKYRTACDFGLNCFVHFIASYYWWRFFGFKHFSNCKNCRAKFAHYSQAILSIVKGETKNTQNPERFLFFFQNISH